jgi:hypothetical protein
MGENEREHIMSGPGVGMLTSYEALEFRPSLQPVGTRFDSTSERAVIDLVIGSAKVLQENCYGTRDRTSALCGGLKSACSCSCLACIMRYITCISRWALRAIRS